MKEIEIHFKGGDGKRIKTLPEVPDNTDYVDLLTSQDINGKKNFTQTPTINGKDIATQETLNEVSNSKQNTLTAGNGISIENDTISVTDAGGLTVLKESDFPLSADLLAKVNANPQNYCLKIDSIMYYYYNNIGNVLFEYYGLASGTLAGSDYIRVPYRRLDSRDGSLSLSYSRYLLGTDSDTIFAKSNRRLSVKAVQDTTDNSVKTGTEIRKAITIRKWH